MKDAWARCTTCHSVDAYAYADGTARCENCGALVLGQGQAEVGETVDLELTIFPLLTWSWSPCQACGSSHGEVGGPENDSCYECGGQLQPLLRRAFTDSAVERPAAGSGPKKRKRCRIGDEGVWEGGHGVHMIGADPFTLLRVLAVRANGDLDLATPDGCSIWLGVPHLTFMLLR